MVCHWEPAVTLARGQDLGKGGVVPLAFGTQDTVCTQCTAGCKENTH